MSLSCFCLLQIFGLQLVQLFQKLAINSNYNYNIVIINCYVMIILIILQIPSILLFTL